MSLYRSLYKHVFINAITFTFKILNVKVSEIQINMSIIIYYYIIVMLEINAIFVLQSGLSKPER